MASASEKVWNRYYNEPEVSSNIKTQKTQTRFLNKIAFHYVPAVKERDIFNEYLISLYRTLAAQSSVEFSKPARTLTNAINEETKMLSENIERTLGVESKIQVPTNFEDIFGSLEFSTLQNSIEVPLKNRGDGLQVRHIPHILQYISDKNKKLNVWGYEEPENSLELSNCFALAEEFKNQFSRSNQIFLTSHSPAFYGIEGDSTTHFSVKKHPKTIVTNGEQSINDVSIVSLVEDMSIVDEELGVAQLIMNKSAEVYEQVKRLRETNSALRHLTKPVLLTEGKTDVVILKAAWNKLREGPCPFEIESCDLGGHVKGTQAGADQLKKVLEATTASERVLRIGLFDYDKKGENCFLNLKQHDFFDFADPRKINNNKKSGALMLPQLIWDDPIFDFTNGWVSIEMLFSRKLFLDDEIGYKFKSSTGSINKSEAMEIIQRLSDPKLVLQVLDISIAFSEKVNFADKVNSFKKEEFANFDTLFQQIESLLAILE